MADILITVTVSAAIIYRKLSPCTEKFYPGKIIIKSNQKLRLSIDINKLILYYEQCSV